MKTILILVVIIILQSCGSSSSFQASQSSIPLIEDDLINKPDGQALFVSNCGFCHTASPGGPDSRFGRTAEEINLSIIAVPQMQVSYLQNLSQTEINSISEYLADPEGYSP